MKKTLLGFAFALLAFVAIGDVSYGQSWYGATVIRNPSWTPGNSYLCVQADRRTLSTGCGSFIQQLIICHKPGPIPCRFNPYPPFDPIGYPYAEAQIEAGVLSGRAVVVEGPRRSVVSWSAPSAAEEGDTHIIESEGAPE